MHRRFQDNFNFTLTSYGKSARRFAAAIPILIGALLTCTAVTFGAVQNPSPSALSSRQVLDKYCVTCHNQRLHVADLMLDKANIDRPTDDPQLWEKVIRKLRARAMPPSGAPHPDEAAYEKLAGTLESELDRAAALRPNPGRPAIHRLNREEYANAVRDLLSVNIDARALLPPDDSGYGFDNIADVLTMSSTLFDRYMSGAKRISRIAVGAPEALPSVETFALSRNLLQTDRMSEDMPLGMRGGLAVRHYFPNDAQYVLRVSLARDTVGDVIRGLNCFGLFVATTGVCGRETTIEFRLDGKRVGSFTVSGPFFADDSGLHVRMSIPRGEHLVAVGFVSAALEPEAPKRPALIGFGKDQTGDVLPSIDKLEIAGPFDISPMVALYTLGEARSSETASQEAIFVCRPTSADRDEPCARQILSKLVRRAYRRSAGENDVESLMQYYRIGRKSGGSFDAGIEMAVRMILVSPNFLFRIERDPANAAPGSSHRLNDFELASRLSFFLWSSIPDDELLDLAARGMLSQSAVLEQQVRRMLKDEKAAALVSNFAGQWLLLRNVRLMTPNTDIFPSFDETLRDAFQKETELFFENVVREDLSVLEFLTANYSFVNERLAQHYGIPNVYGSRFRKVVFPEGSPRGGLLGHASLLMVTSYANRTSPVQRGKWVLTNILGSPPPAPPPNVPSLPDVTPGKPRTMRERMEEHRRNPACASCHMRMDPIGFALENFDAIGAWRTDEDGAPIDAAGVLPDGNKIAGAADLRKALLKHKSEFLTTLTENLLTYALGRGVEYYDEPAVRKIVHSAAASNYRWSSLVLGVVNSTPFQMRRSTQP